MNPEIKNICYVILALNNLKDIKTFIYNVLKLKFEEDKRSASSLGEIFFCRLFFLPLEKTEASLAQYPRPS
jgi:hypothetical protein